MLPAADLLLVGLGLVVGSLVETLYQRGAWALPRQLQRLQCPACHAPRSAWVQVPLLGSLALARTCHHCGARASRARLATETGFLLVTLWAVMAAGDGTLWASVGLGWLLVLLARIDLADYILPDELNLAVGVLALAILPFDETPALLDHLAGGVGGFGLLWALDAAYRRFRGRSGLGRGDAKLLGALGLWVGLSGLPSVLMLASASGLVAALAQSMRQRQPVQRTSMIAFGPWLALGGWLTWLYGPISLLTTG